MLDAGAGSGDFLLEAAEAARVAGVGFYGLWVNARQSQLPSARGTLGYLNKWGRRNPAVPHIGGLSSSSYADMRFW